MEKQLLSALENLQHSYAQQQNEWQNSYASLQSMFDTTLNHYTQNQQENAQLSEQVTRLQQQVEDLNKQVISLSETLPLLLR
ncbi:MbeD family mobilization/exclusion protein [Morganella morganii]|uniref:MbeD family mobilization/exclusion protein n=1 Tax=Morganella morganii TaxID=582 RepID=UPI003A8892D4